MTFVKIGLAVMALSLLSTAITIPLGKGPISGIAFVIGMVFSWIAGIAVMARWAFRRWQVDKEQ